VAEVKNEKAPGQRCLADQTPLSGLEPSGSVEFEMGRLWPDRRSLPAFNPCRREFCVAI